MEIGSQIEIQPPRGNVAVVLRIGALSRVTVFALLTSGCGSFVSRPPTLEYVEASVRVDVRADTEPFEADFTRAKDEDETLVAHCRTPCRLALRPGLYRVRVHGDAPEAHKVYLFRHHTHVLITKGSTALRGLGLGLEATGGLGLAVLTLGAISAPRNRDQIGHVSEEHGVGNLAIIGGLGAAALTMGIMIHQTSRTRIQVDEVQENPWAEQSQLRPAVDAKGVGFSF
jgi:hypothetical protein